MEGVIGSTKTGFPDYGTVIAVRTTTRSAVVTGSHKQDLLEYSLLVILKASCERMDV